MNKVKEIWNNDSLRCGGFYEMAIEVSDNISKEPIERLSQKIFNLDIVQGPFDKTFNKKEIDLKYFENIGLLKIENKKLPFKTFYVSEESDGGRNWFDISIYTGILEEILGREFQTWSTEAKWHKGLDNLLVQILKELNTEFKIKLGVLGFEVSGIYELDWLKNNELKRHDTSHTRFYINEEDLGLIHSKNRSKVRMI